MARIAISNPDSTVKPGSYSRVSIETTRIRSATAVPREAILSDRSGESVNGRQRRSGPPQGCSDGSVRPELYFGYPRAPTGRTRVGLDVFAAARRAKSQDRRDQGASACGQRTSPGKHCYQEGFGGSAREVRRTRRFFGQRLRQPALLGVKSDLQ